MIRLQKYTPNIYYERSRDFQFIGRLYDVILNSVKTNADIIKYGLPFSESSSQELLKIMSMTLGFKPKHKYSRQQLLAVCEVFTEILKNKGNIKAIQLMGEAILKAEGILGEIACFMQYDGTNHKDLPVLRIIVPEKLAEIALFYDLLDYIIPAGCIVEIIRGEFLAPIEADADIVTSSEFIILDEIDGNLVTKQYRYKIPVHSMNPIQSNIDKFGQPINELSKNHIANSFVWRKGNRRIQSKKTTDEGNQ